MADLFDEKTGQAVPITDAAEAEAGFKSGRYTLPADARVNVYNPDGELVSLSAQSAAQHIGRGYRFATSSEVAAAKQHAEYGDSPVTAGALGLARGATFNLSDVALGAAGFGEEVKGYQAANPEASAVGEVGGALAGLGKFSALGKAGAAARGLSAPARGAMLLGRGAEKVTEGALKYVTGSAAKQGLARALTKAVPTAVAAGTETALYQAGKTVAEAQIEDKELSAEHLIAETGLGFLYGAAAGGGLSFGASALRGAVVTGAKAGARAVEPVTNKIGTALKDALSKPNLERFASEQAFKSTGARKLFVQRAFKKAGGVEAHGKALLDHGIVTADASLETIAARLDEKVPQIGEELGAVLKQAEATGPAAQPSYSRIFTDAKKLGEKLRETPLGSANKLYMQIKQEFEPFFERFAPLGRDAEGKIIKNAEPITLTELHAFRAKVDDVINYDKANPLNKELRNFRNILEREIEATVGRSGDDMLKRYQGLKKDYGRLSLMREATNDTIARDAANRSFSLSDHLVGIGGAAAVGGLNPASLATGFVMGRLNKFMRERGSQILAVTANKAAQGQALSAVTASIDQRIAKGAMKFLEATKKAGEGARLATRRTIVPLAGKTFEDKVDEIQKFRANPQAAISVIGNRIGGVSSVAPEVGSHVAAKAMVATEFLASKTPRSALKTDPLTSRRLKDRVSDVEQTKFNRYVRAVENPMSVIDDMEDGHLTREGVETLKTVYPKLYGQLVTGVMDSLSRRKDKVSYEERLQLGILLGTPTHATLSPTFIRTIQSVYQAAQAPQEPEQGGTVTPGNRRPPEVAQPMMTKSQQLAQGI